jgi:hypothetical protein
MLLALTLGSASANVFWITLIRGWRPILAWLLSVAQCKKHHAEANIHHPHWEIEPGVTSDQSGDAPDQS